MSADQRIAADPVTQARTGTEDITDEALAALLATDPYVKRSGPYLTIETQPEELPPKPEACPVCGEPYERVSYDRDSDDGTHIAQYIHHLTGFGGDWCEAESDWRAQEVITVEYERARRVSGR